MCMSVALRADVRWAFRATPPRTDYEPSSTAIDGGTGSRPTPPSPYNRESEVATGRTLSWEAGPMADSQDVYFGTGRVAVLNAVIGSPEFKSRQADTAYDPGVLLPGTTYFWRIDPIIDITDCEPAYPCLLWSFTTASAPTGDADEDGVTDAEDNCPTVPNTDQADGQDDVPGTQDDNLRLSSGSPCIDAGDNTAFPADSADLDDDEDMDEPIPLDLDLVGGGWPRLFQPGVLIRSRCQRDRGLNCWVTLQPGA